mgnify:CR=1 FL=1
MNLSSSIILMGGAQSSAFSITESLSHLKSYSGEIILVLTQEYSTLAQNFPNLKLIVIPHWNAGHAVNEALQLATGESLFFIGVGGVISGEGISILEEELWSAPSVGVVAPLGNTSGWQSVQYFIGPQSTLNIESSEGVLDIQAKLKQRFAGQSKKVKSTEFCGLGIQRKLLQALGGFDERLSEDIAPLDIAWRVQLMGKEIRIVQSVYLYFSSWQNQISLTLDAEVKKYSTQVLSQKLLEHYEAKDSIPSSWDLWEVEHFQLDLPEKFQNKVSQPVLNERSKPAIILYASSEDFNISISMSLTLSQLKSYGVASENILLIDASGQASGVEIEDKNIVIWTLNDMMGWSALLPRLQSWFPAKELLVMRAGSQIEPHSWRFLVTQFEAKENHISTGELYSSQGEIYRQLNSVGFFDWTNTLSRAPMSQFIIPQSLNIFGEAEMEIDWDIKFQFKADFNVSPLGSDKPMTQPIKTNHSFDQNSIQIQNPHQDDIQVELNSKEIKYSLEVQELINQATYPGFWIDDTYVDKFGQAIDKHMPDLIVLHIEPLDMPAFSAVLNMMKHPGLKKLIAIFDNNYLQQGTIDDPYDHFGISPYDLRREVELAGYNHLKWSAYGCEVQQNQSQYAGTQINLGLRTEFETLMSTAPTMMLEATLCQENYDLTKKVSIVVLGLNKIEYTAQCIESTNKYCKQEIEWILVNNGSTDGTQAYFDLVPGAKVIHNDQNIGVAAGWNQGMKIATGDYVLILNNDVILAPGSIENLVRCAMNHPQSGLIAPRSNSIAGPQIIDGFKFENELEIPKILQDMMEKNTLSSWQFPMIKGFCMLIPMNVMNEVGYFDESFGFGNFEDDDYSQRVAREGYDLRVANDSIIFHYGSVSFGQANIDWEQQMVKNQAIYEEKWINGRPSIFEFKEGYKVPKNVFINSSDSVSPKAKVIKTIDALLKEEVELQSLIRGDIGDALVYKAMAKVQEDLMKPKEAFQSYCKSLEFDSHQIDIDVEIVDFLKTNFDFEERDSVIHFLSTKFPHLSNFKLQSENLSTDDYQWIEKVQLHIESGQYDEASQILDFAKSHSGQSYEWHNFKGLVAWYHGALDQAYEYFKQGLLLNPTEEDVLLNLFDCGIKLRLIDDVEVIIEKALSLDSGLSEARKCLEVIKNTKLNGGLIADDLIESRELNLQVENFIREGLLDYALDSVMGVLEKYPKDYRALNNQGLIYWYQGEIKIAITHFQTSIELNPWYTDAILNLYDCSLLVGEIQNFNPVLDRCIQIYPTNPELLQARKEIQLGQIPERLSSYRDNHQEKTREKTLLAQAQDFINTSQFEKAVLILTDLLNEGKELAEAYNALGIISFYWGNFDDAKNLVTRSLSLQPLNEDALLNLWDICIKLDDVYFARKTLSDALSMDPGLSQVQSILNGGAL